MESALMISPPKSCARATAAAVLPMPVGPQTTKSGGFLLSAVSIGSLVT
jgi:hypothetical protein